MVHGPFDIYILGKTLASLTLVLYPHIVLAFSRHKSNFVLAGRKNMRKPYTACALLISFLVSIPAFTQSSNASLSGAVSDAAKALIPGVTVTATNVETGVVSTGITNES
jgi:hypothetical protein